MCNGYVGLSYDIMSVAGSCNGRYDIMTYDNPTYDKMSGTLFAIGIRSLERVRNLLRSLLKVRPPSKNF